MEIRSHGAEHSNQLNVIVTTMFVVLAVFRSKQTYKVQEKPYCDSTVLCLFNVAESVRSWMQNSIIYKVKT